MKTFNDYVSIYKEQLEKEDIQKAYIKLVKYVMRLKSILSKNLSHGFSFGNIFQGYMDYTYFYFSNRYLKDKKLRFGVVLNHPQMRFELWLLGQNLEIQESCWNLLKTSKWNNSRTTKPQYSVLETVIIENPDFNDLEALTQQIEIKISQVSNEIIDYLKIC